MTWSTSSAEHLFLPDLGLLYVVLGYRTWPIAWKVIRSGCYWSAPSSSGKSEMLNALKLLPEYHAVSTFTEAGLLSGSSMGRLGVASGDGRAEASWSSVI